MKGKVTPITKSKAELSICLHDGTCIKGENKINNSDLQTVGISSISYAENVELNPHAEFAIMKADIIILGPGNYYCSVLPNLIVEGCKEALCRTPAKIVFPVNLTNKQYVALESE